jgi:effector-binding domain-containing protein
MLFNGEESPKTSKVTLRSHLYLQLTAGKVQATNAPSRVTYLSSYEIFSVGVKMKLNIVNTPFELTLYGKSKTHDRAKSYGDELPELLNGVWEKVKRDHIPTTGINHVVYGDQDEIFAGVAITMPGEPIAGLAVREIVLHRYAYYKYVGPYAGLPQANQEIRLEIERQGLETTVPMLEIYGHWNEDESKLETELLYNIS